MISDAAITERAERSRHRRATRASLAIYHDNMQKLIGRAESGARLISDHTLYLRRGAEIFSSRERRTSRRSALMLRSESARCGARVRPKRSRRAWLTFWGVMNDVNEQQARLTPLVFGGGSEPRASRAIGHFP